MSNIKKAITVSGILLNNFVSLSLIIMFCCLGNLLHAQMPGDFPEGIDFDPRHPRVAGEQPALSAHKTKSLVSEANISENVEFVGATEGAVYDVFVQGNYAYICAGCFLVILDVSAPSNPTKVGSVALPDDGKLGGQIEAAMLWGDPCPVQIKGKPIFWWFFDLEGLRGLRSKSILTSEEKDKCVELLRKIIAERMKLGEQLTGRTIRVLARKLVLHDDISSRLYAEVSLSNHEEVAKNKDVTFSTDFRNG